MQRRTSTLLSRESLEKIQGESLRILEKIGLRVEDSGCKEILQKAGAKVVGQTDVVRLPAQMVSEAMAQINRRFELVHPSGERFWVPDDKPRVGTRVKMPKILDYGERESRPPRRQDVINLCRIANALAGVEFTVAIQYPCSDVPAQIDIADTLGLALAVTGKLSYCSPSTLENAMISLDVAAAGVGSSDFDRNPGTWFAVNTTSPLVLGAREGSILRYVAGNHLPIDVEPMPVAGASTPFTLAGTLAVANAEVLFLCTLANAIWPGAKIIDDTTSSIMNMRDANLSQGGPETCLLSWGNIALAQYHGIPTLRMGGYSDSYYPDIQAGIEKAFATLMLVQGDSDLILMGGPLDRAGHSSYEQAVIDHDIWEFAQRIAAGFEVSDETIAYETVERVGHGGSYMAEDHTYRWVRSGEHYYGGSFNRSGLLGEENTMLAKAHQRVLDIVNEPFEYGAPVDAVNRIKECVRDHARHENVTSPEWTV